MEEDCKFLVNDLKKEYKDVRKFFNQKDKFFIENCVLYRKIIDEIGEQRQLLFFEVLKKIVLENIYNYVGY